MSKLKFFWIAAVCLLVLIIGIFLGTGINYGMDGDDIFFFSPALREIFFQNTNLGYAPLVRSRGFLPLTYIALFKTFQSSIPAMHAFFAACWIGGAFLFYSLLRRFYLALPSALGALFYLFYVGKYETVGWISAGQYHVVIMILILSLLILTTERWTLKARTVAISILYWISIHWYEILMPLAPLFTLFIFYKKWRVKDAISKSDAFTSVLPCLITLGHVALIATNPNPIWRRSESFTLAKGILELPNLFFLILSNVFGPEHQKLISRSFKSYSASLHAPEGILIALGTALMLIAMVALLFALHKREPSAQKPDNKILSSRNLTFLGAYLFLIAPLIALPVVFGGDNVPSRLTFLSSMGLSILLCAFLNSQIQKKLFASWVVLISLIVGTEAVAMRSVLFQYASSVGYDENVLAQLKSFRIDPSLGDTIVMSIPMTTSIEKIWRLAPSKIDSGQAQSLIVIAYPALLTNESTLPLHKRLFYKRTYGSDLETLNLDPVLDDFETSPNSFFVFKQMQNGKLCMIKNVDVPPQAGHAFFHHHFSRYQETEGLCYLDAVATAPKP